MSIANRDGDEQQIQKSKLTPAQDRFLRALELDCDALQPPTRVLAAIKPTLLARWLAQPAFRKRLMSLLRVVRHRAEMSLWLAAARAAERISGSLEPDQAIESDLRRTCVDLIRLARQSPLRRRGRTAESSGRCEMPQQELAHPDLSRQEAAALIQKLR